MITIRYAYDVPGHAAAILQRLINLGCSIEYAKAASAAFVAVAKQVPS